MYASFLPCLSRSSSSHQTGQASAPLSPYLSPAVPPHPAPRARRDYRRVTASSASEQGVKTGFAASLRQAARKRRFPRGKLQGRILNGNYEHHCTRPSYRTRSCLPTLCSGRPGVHLWVPFGSSVTLGKIQRILARPLRKDDAHKPRSVHNNCAR